MRRIISEACRWLGNLNVADDVRVATFLITRIHRSCRVAVRIPVDHGRVGVQRIRVQQRIDL